MTRSLVVSIFLLLGAVLAFGAASATAAGRALIGVQDDYLSSAYPDEVGHRLDMLEATGAAITRVDVLWRDIAPRRPAAGADPDDPAYDWSRIDAVMRGLAARDLDAILTAYSTPPWATDRDAPEGSAVNPGHPDVAAYADFMQALATRYSGRHTPPGASAPLPEGRLIEVWNEPNLQRFLAPQWRDGAPVARLHYVALLRAAYPRIKAANPKAIVLGGAGGPRSSTGATGMGAFDWLRGVARSGAPFDAYSQHVYPAVAPWKGTRGFPAWKTLPYLFRELDRYRAHRGKELYVTETGYTTRRTPLRRVVFTEQEQAANLAAIFRTKVLRSGRIPVVMWFNLTDNDDWPGGLMASDGTRKRSWWTFRTLARVGRAPRPAPRRARTARQLLIDQRISQAALRNVAAVERYLDGLGPRDLRPGGLLAESFDRTIVLAGRPGVEGSRPLRRRIPMPRAAKLKRVTPLPRTTQARVNLRIARAALRRTMALEIRLTRGLTGGDLRDGAVSGSALAGGLQVAEVVAGPVAKLAATPTKSPRRVRLGAWARNPDGQAVAQEAIRRLWRIRRTLERGLTSAHFRPGSLSAQDLAGG